MPTIEQFVAVLNDEFNKAIKNKPGNLWSPEVVLETYQKAIQNTLNWASGIAP